MDKDRDFLLFLANRIIGPAFLVVGAWVGSYMLVSQGLPIARKAMDEGVTPDFGFLALVVLLPFVVAYIGWHLVKVKKLR